MPPSRFPLIRHLSYRLTPLLARTHFTPNQITGAGLVLGVGGAWCFVQVMLAVSILKGETSVAEVARKRGLTVAEAEIGQGRFLRGEEDDLRSHPKDESDDSPRSASWDRLP